MLVTSGCDDSGNMYRYCAVCNNKTDAWVCPYCVPMSKSYTLEELTKLAPKWREDKFSTVVQFLVWVRDHGDKYKLFGDVAELKESSK